MSGVGEMSDYRIRGEVRVEYIAGFLGDALGEYLGSQMLNMVSSAGGTFGGYGFFGNLAQLRTRKRENEKSEGHRLWQIGEEKQCFQGMRTACFVKLGEWVAQMPPCSGQNGVSQGRRLWLYLALKVSKRGPRSQMLQWLRRHMGV